jgi:hypothetical protein
MKGPNWGAVLCSKNVERTSALNGIPREKVVVNGRAICPCVISNLSNGGANISEVISAEIPERFELHFPAVIAPRLCRVSWRKDTELGVRFLASAKARQPTTVKDKKARRREPVE